MYAPLAEILGGAETHLRGHLVGGMGRYAVPPDTTDHTEYLQGFNTDIILLYERSDGKSYTALT